MNEDSIDVSVVMPVFNGSSFVDDAIQSIMSQTHCNFEVILIDDGSTDNSLELLKCWAEKDQRITVYEQENKGRSFTRNKGLKLAKSNLVAFMDSDDISLPMRLAKEYHFMIDNPEVVVVGGHVHIICMKGLYLAKSSHAMQHEEIEKALLFDEGFQLCQPAVMVRKSAVFEAGAYNEDLTVGEDTDLFLRMALIGKLANLSDVVLEYRHHLQNSTAQENIKSYLESIPRIKQAWQDRDMQLPSDFEHWSSLQVRSQKTDLLQWGWNALALGEKVIARYYARKLLVSREYDLMVLRFFFCVLRGR